MAVTGRAPGRIRPCARAGRGERVRTPRAGRPCRRPWRTCGARPRPCPLAPNPPPAARRRSGCRPRRATRANLRLAGEQRVDVRSRRHRPGRVVRVTDVEEADGLHLGGGQHRCKIVRTVVAERDPHDLGADELGRFRRRLVSGFGHDQRALRRSEGDHRVMERETRARVHGEMFRAQPFERRPTPPARRSRDTDSGCPVWRPRPMPRARVSTVPRGTRWR